MEKGEKRKSEGDGGERRKKKVKVSTYWMLEGFAYQISSLQRLLRQSSAYINLIWVF